MFGFVEINYLGHSSFRIRGKQKTVVTDPFDERVGKFPPDVNADIVTVSHDHADHNQTDKVHGSPFVVHGPGEYEVGGVSIIGIATFHDDKNGEERGNNNVYVIEIDELRIAHLGDLGHKLAQDQLEEMGRIDILLVPTGGVYTIDAKTAAEVTKQVDPWVVIPMHYQAPNRKLSEQLAEVGEFLKEIGKPEVVPAPKYSVSADRLPEELQVIVLERKS